MRAAILAILMFAAPAHAGVEETLVGWSPDGKHYAVVIDDSAQSGEHRGASLQVRDATDKVIVTLPSDADPSRGADRVDVTKLPKLAKYRLARVDDAARARFKDEFFVWAFGGIDPANPQGCRDAGWKLQRRSSHQTVTLITGPGCFGARVGYLDASGRRALVRITHSSSSFHEPESGNDAVTKFVTVHVPPAAPAVASTK